MLNVEYIDIIKNVILYGSNIVIVFFFRYWVIFYEFGNGGNVNIKKNDLIIISGNEVMILFFIVFKWCCFVNLVIEVDNLVFKNFVNLFSIFFFFN